MYEKTFVALLKYNLQEHSGTTI